MLFADAAGYYERLEAVPSRLKMIDILAEMFRGLEPEEVAPAIYMTQGILLPPFEGREFGVAEKLVEEALALSTGHDKRAVEELYIRKGDMGLAAEELKRSTRLKGIVRNSYGIREIYSMMMKIAEAGGPGSKDQKIKMLANMISAASPLEAKFIARYPLGALRLGVGDSTILEALALAYTGSREAKPELERAYNTCSDLGLVGARLKKEGMRAITDFRITLFKPVRPALAERLATAEEIMERMGGEAAVEQKYDGFRIQIHKKGGEIRLYSRRLEDTTAMFPDIVDAVRRIRAESAIFEGEALAYNEETSEYLPFQETIQRKRKHGIAEKREELPLHLFAFDLLYLNGMDYLSEPYEKRRDALEALVMGSEVIEPTRRILTGSPKELERFFETSVSDGLEGIMVKDLKAPYVAGARKFSWIKLKRSYRGALTDTLDLVIVGFYSGRGSRAEFGFGGLLCAVYNRKRDMFETVSRIGTGFTEAQMTELHRKLERIKRGLKPARVDSVVEPRFWVAPKYVVTVNADEITRSPMHTCGRSTDKEGIGYALRFPRLYGDEAIRPDKGPEEATTTEEVIEMFRMQRKVGVKE